MLRLMSVLAALFCFQPISSLFADNVSTKPSTDIVQMEKKTLELVNEYRATKELPPLQLDPKISEACREHSRDMASGKMELGHDGFDERVDSIKIPYSSVAENVAWNRGHSDPGDQAVKSWIKSTGHRVNMEGKFTLTGIGIAKNSSGAYYFTQIFIQPN